MANTGLTFEFKLATKEEIMQKRGLENGGHLCRELFVIASRELYSKKVSDNAKVARFYEEFAGWIEEQDRKRNFPDLPAPLSAQSIEVLTGGYLFDLGEMDARYQIQCALTYYKD